MSLCQPPQSEQQQKQYPYQSLPHDVWSGCLSYLPPNELSQASELLPLASTSTSTNQSNTSSSNCSDKDAEYAAWLAIQSMVEAAENFWEAEEAQVENETKGFEEEESTINTTTHAAKQSNIHKLDTQAVRLRQLVSKDVSMVGDLFRATTSTSNSNSNSASGCSNQNETTRQEERTAVVRFRDETWQELYGFLYSVLSVKYEYDYACNLLMGGADDDDDSDGDGEVYAGPRSELGIDNDTEKSEEDNVAAAGIRDKEAIALTVGLVFGKPSLRGSLMTPQRRQRLGLVSRSCSNVARCDPLYARINMCFKNGGLGHSRCYLLSLRLAEEGFWDDASDIIKSKLPSEEDESLLSIDGMIYASTFLIDRLYSQTYVKHAVNDEELATAVKLGRKAVLMAEQLHTNMPTTSSSNWSPASETFLIPGRGRNKKPPPPMRSLFTNNAVRYMHAKLALGKALALLAQHIGLKATDTTALELQHRVVPRGGTCSDHDHLPTHLATPELRAEHERLWMLAEEFPHVRERVAWTNAFFEEARKELQEGLLVCEEQERLLQQEPSSVTRSCNSPCTSTIPILPLQGALESAESERQYCVAGASAALGKRETAHHYSRKAIESFTSAFRTMMEGVLDVLASSSTSYGNNYSYHDRKDSSLTPKLQLYPTINRLLETTLDYLIRCGKDLGKTCGFADYVGVDYREGLLNTDNGEQLQLLNPELLFDFVHLVSIYKHGSFHPTTKNIQRLAEQRRPNSNQTSLAQKYNNVAAWLVADFCNDE